MTDSKTPHIDVDAIRSWGASPQAIESHYGIGNPFYELWLDPTMSYTSGRFNAEAQAQPGSSVSTKNPPSDPLHRAQWHKYEAIASDISPHDRPLQSICDIGCGWGGALVHLKRHHDVESATGLTLSVTQASWTRQQYPDLGLQILEESWQDHQPKQLYDALISVEAIEAFVNPKLSPSQRLSVYRHFFRRCHEWLRPQGRFWLQAIVYGNSTPADLDPFIMKEIFPESDLPLASELFAASHCLFEPVSLVNQRSDYVQTLDHWIGALKAHRSQAETLTSPARVKQFLRYLRLSRHMFESGACDLLRIVFQKTQSRK
jgi:cyclopropane-fatty-acyl-phospholipid synthase